MTTFEFNKRIDEIEEPVLLPEDWYPFRISEEPELAENKAKTGKNLVIRLECISDNPIYKGRIFTIWLAWPSVEDSSSYTARGENLYDLKMRRIAGFVEAFEGSVQGSTIDIVRGGRGLAYVTVGLDQQGKGPVNSIDSFSGFKPYAPF